MMNRKRTLFLALLVAVISSAGCAYRHYLGISGPSIWNFPEIHQASIKEDVQCLKCHTPGNHEEDAPITDHSAFKGCLKCHNGPVD